MRCLLGLLIISFIVSSCSSVEDERDELYCDSHNKLYKWIYTSSIVDELDKRGMIRYRDYYDLTDSLFEEMKKANTRRELFLDLHPRLRLTRDDSVYEDNLYRRNGLDTNDLKREIKQYILDLI